MPSERTKAKLHFALGQSGGTMSRFRLVPVAEPTSRSEAALRHGHPAMSEGRTVFPTRVCDAGQRDHILMRGFHNSKIGDRITKGAWAGFPIFTVTLEERATCPRSCAVWDACYGNAMPVAVRFRYNDGFLLSLEEELVAVGDRYPLGFAVRAHVLGDFVSLDYVRHWQLWLELVPQLHVWGYTAHQAGTPVGDTVRFMNDLYPGRWAFRHSVTPGTEVTDWQASTTWEKPTQAGRALRGAGGLICPAEMGATAACGSCGLCWSPNAASTRIVFLGHGIRRPKGARPRKPDAKYARPIPASRNTPPALPSERFATVEAFIASRGVTKLPPAKARGL